MKLVQFRKFFWLLSFCVCFSSFSFWSSSSSSSSSFQKKQKALASPHEQRHHNTHNEEEQQQKKNQIDQIIIKIKMQGARQSDVFFGERESGQDVRQSNVTAVQAVANIVKSSLGPVGLDKVF
jgi:lipopolysaccharide export LptBFGC system permease protein LptF